MSGAVIFGVRRAQSRLCSPRIRYHSAAKPPGAAVPSSHLPPIPLPSLPLYSSSPRVRDEYCRQRPIPSLTLRLTWISKLMIDGGIVANSEKSVYLHQKDVSCI